MEDGEVTEASQLLVERVRWESISADLTGVLTETDAFATIRYAIQKEVDEADGTPIVFRMTLFGVTPLHRMLHSEPERIADEVSRCLRLLTLQLERYGHFTDKTLKFRPDASLHIVYGANEAGKTSMVAAIKDLFFGIGAGTDFDFLHPSSRLSLGGTIVGEFEKIGRVREPRYAVSVSSGKGAP